MPGSASRERRAAIGRHLLLLCSLVALLAAASGYAWIQTPLREAVALGKHLARNVGRIMTLDEVLTMSAKMAAASRDPAYERRYNANVDELDALIKATTSLIPDSEAIAAVHSTDEANQRLVDMETKSFELDHEGRFDEALKMLESEAYRSDKLAYSSGMQRAFSILERLTAERAATVERQALLLQIGAAASLLLAIVAWMLEQRDRRRQAAAYAANLEGIVAQRTEELSRRNRSMRLVLDTIQEGLVSLNAEGWMASERSAIVDRWFGPAPERVKFSDYVRPYEAIFADSLELGLEQFRDGLITVEMCLDQMPKRFRALERTIGVEYEVVLIDGTFSGLLVVMTDITAELEAARAEQEQRDLLRVFECIGRDRTGFVHFLEEAEQIVGDLRGDAQLPMTRALRLLHTLKGNAAQFGASRVAGVCHDIETRLTEQGELSPSDRDWLDMTWRSFMERVSRMVTDRSETHLEVERVEFQQVVQLVRRRQHHDDILRALSNWELDPVLPRLERLADYARALAERLGKAEIDVECDAQALRVDSATWGPFWSVCVHLVRNAVDHGIEPSEVRTAAGKSPRGNVLLSALLDEGEFIIEISDDGAGIDWAAVIAQAAARGLPVTTEVERVEALFADGVSTRDSATDVSGRGVGMAAVRDEVRRLGGTISVDSNLHRGTTCVMRFPARAMLRAVPSMRPSNNPVAKAVSS